MGAAAKAALRALLIPGLLGCGGLAAGPQAGDVSAAETALSGAPTHDAVVSEASGAHEHAASGSTLLAGLRRADFVGVATVRKAAGRDGTTGRAGMPAIWTDVELTLDHAVKDSRGVAASGRFTLSFLGGRVGTREMHVDHFPSFEPGEQVLLIAKSDEKPCPTFAGEFGVLRVRGGRVFTSFGHPVVGITESGYEVRTPREQMPTAPVPVPLGNASGEAVMPVPGDAEDALLVDDAAALLGELVEAAG